MEEIINKLVKRPLTLTEASIDEILQDFPKNRGLFKVIAKRIFDLNDDTVLNRSDADEGAMGKLNKRSRNKRNKKYFKKIRKGFRTIEGNKVIFAEGDSWFEFPIFVNDIIDWLNKGKKHAIYSLAYGGDWLSNILYEGEYIEDISIHKPDVFLISGGGNDLVGGYRLTYMVQNKGIPDMSLRPSIQKKIKEFNANKSYNIMDERVEKGMYLLSREFYAFVNLMKLQYRFLFQSLRKKYKEMLIITQGYDYAIPSNKVNWGTNIINWHQPLMNWIIGSGGWLQTPLLINGIGDQQKQRNIVRGMIFVFNEMLIEEGKRVEPAVHIDSRDLLSDIVVGLKS